MALGDNVIPNIEKKTGKATKEFVALAVAKGFDDPFTKPEMDWLKADFGLGHGHAMAMSSQNLSPARGRSVQVGQPQP